MNYRYFENKDCEFYPCHNMGRQNCLFCYCPLYFLDCGGNCVMIEREDGRTVKDCSDCKVPHTSEGYDYIIKKLKETGA